MKFKAVEFDKEVHMDVLNALLGKRGITMGDPKYLPPTGLVIHYYEQPVAIGFMIKCDNGMVIHTDFVSDIGAPKDLRNKAVEILRTSLDEMALAQGFAVVTAFCKIPRHVKNLKEKGYTEFDQNLTQLGRFLWR